MDFAGVHHGTGYMVVSGELLNKAKLDEHGKRLDGFVIWDILVYESEYLIGKTTIERLELLENIFPSTRMKVTETGIQEYQHLCLTNLQGIYKVPTYTKYFEGLYTSLIQTDLYEGMVLKKVKATLDFGFNSDNNSRWQLKIRKPTKNYAF